MAPNLWRRIWVLGTRSLDPVVEPSAQKSYRIWLPHPYSPWIYWGVSKQIGSFPLVECTQGKMASKIISIITDIFDNKLRQCKHSLTEIVMAHQLTVYDLDIYCYYGIIHSASTTFSPCQCLLLVLSALNIQAAENARHRSEFFFYQQDTLIKEITKIFIPWFWLKFPIKTKTPWHFSKCHSAKGQ